MEILYTRIYFLNIDFFIFINIKKCNLFYHIGLVLFYANFCEQIKLIKIKSSSCLMLSLD